MKRKRIKLCSRIRSIRKVKTIVILLVFCLFYGNTLWAESIDSENEIILQQNEGNIIIKGIVKDKSDNSPLTGVNIVDKENQKGGISHMNGEFTINVKKRDKVTLVFTFIGMKTKEVVWSGEPYLTVIMEEDSEAIDEVVITGVFERKAESFTGSAATYNREQLKSIGTQNVLQSLQSVDPSFNITANNLLGSNPNQLPDIDIRGKASLTDPRNTYTTDPNQPLFILDGFEVSLQDVVNLNINRIQSVTLLKDAASTAIYGSQAANGVLVIETVKPKPGRLRVEYSGTFELEIPDLSDYNLMNSEEKLKYELAAGVYNSKFEDQDFDYKRLYSDRLRRVLSGVDTYWLDEPIRNSFSNKHNLYIDGGDQTITYGIGANYANKQGVMKESGNNILGLTLDLQYRTKKFMFSNKFALDYYEHWNPQESFSTFAQTNQYYEVPSSNTQTRYLEEWRIRQYTGTPSEAGTWVREANPLYNNGLNHLNEGNSLSFRNNFYADWRPIDGIKITGRFSIEAKRGKTEIFKSPFHTDFDKTTATEQGSYSKNTTDATTYSGDLTFSYYKVLKEKHQVNIAANAKIRSSKEITDTFKAVGFSDDIMPYPSFANQYEVNGIPSYNQIETRSSNYFINGGYVYDQRYALDLTYRRDGSSNFGRQNLYTNTWSTGIAWNIHYEDFARNWADLLKIRFTIGNPGNNSTKYLTSTTYKYYTKTNLFGTGLYVKQYGSDNLDWEKTLDINAGIDFTSKDKRFSFIVDIYRKTADPLIIRLDAAPSTGRDNLLTNMGRNTIKGITFTTNVNIINQAENRFVWSVGVNGSHKTSKLSKMGDVSSLNESFKSISSLRRYQNGRSQSDIWAVKSAGIDPSTGDEIYIKKDGTYSFTYDQNDEAAVGNTEPDLEGRINSTFRYKGFSASIFLHYIIGADEMNSVLFNRIEGIDATGALTKNQDKRAYYDRWKEPGDISKFRRINDLSPKDNYLTDRFLQKKSWLAGESISLGYDFAGYSWLKKVYLENCSVRFTLNNLFHWSTIKQERGIDYPFARTAALTVNLTF